MFQRALPEVDGLGVITSTPGLIRSSQPAMCFGLPLRTTNTTTESDEIPFSAFASQLLATIPSLTRRVMSGVVENATTSAGWPVSTARLCEPEAPNDWLNVTPLPLGLCPNAVGQRVIGLLRRRIGDQRKLRARLPLAEADAGVELELVSDDPPHPATTPDARQPQRSPRHAEPPRRRQSSCHVLLSSCRAVSLRIRCLFNRTHLTLVGLDL